MWVVYKFVVIRPDYKHRCNNRNHMWAVGCMLLAAMSYWFKVTVSDQDSKKFESNLQMNQIVYNQLIKKVELNGKISGEQCR